MGREGTGDRHGVRRDRGQTWREAEISSRRPRKGWVGTQNEREASDKSRPWSWSAFCL